MPPICQARRATRDAVLHLQAVRGSLEATRRELAHDIGEDEPDCKQIENGLANLDWAIRYTASAYGLLAVRSVE